MLNIRKLYVIQFFSSLIPAYVIERLFWEMRGMSVPMVVMTEIIYAVTIVLLEVPSGIVADKRGRKQMLILSAALGCLEFLLLVFATEFWHFALVVLLAAVAKSASSGAENALLYDSLRSEGKDALFEKCVGRMNAISIIATMIAALSGSLLADRYGLTFNYWLSLGSMIVATAATLLLKESERQDKDDEESAIPMKTYVAEAIRFFRSHPAVYAVMLTGMTIGAAITYVDEFWQLYLALLGIPTAAFGLFSAGLFLIRLPGSLLAYKLKDVMSMRAILLVVTVITGAGYAYLAYVPDGTGLVALFLICLTAGVIEPLASGYLHHRIDSSMRATMDSFQSLCLYGTLVIVGAGFGYVAARIGLLGGFGFLSVFVLVFGLRFAVKINQ